MLIDIPIQLIKLEDNSFHILIEADICKKKGNLIIDTGASKTIFDQNFVSSFITDVEEIEDNQSSGINAMITTPKQGTIPIIKLHEHSISNLKTVLMDMNHINTLYKKIADFEISGLIGSDFLLKYDAVINYHQLKLSLNL